ncbi:MAG TPA: heavy metal translocating P-type ATPase [Rhodoplanes sp.]|nr:heavy metal translocating P-type ATPase [Rhodoplanes sp.]
MTETTDLSHFVERLDDGRARMNLAVEGMTCAACMLRVEGGLTALPNVTRARVNLTNGRVAVEWREGKLDPSAIVGKLNALGYKAYPFDTRRAESKEQDEARFLLRCLGVAAFASMNVMLLSVSVWSGNATDITPEQRDFFHWLSALIALPAAAYAGQPFFRSAMRALMGFRLNMDVPITLGVVLALALSVFETLRHAEHAYFDSAVMLLTFLLAGRYLDQNMRRRTRAVAANLAALKAETAVKFVSSDEIREVPVEAIEPGDVVLVRPGERIAVDGEVIEGRSEIDQSLVTGETAHVAAEKGAHVYAGTMNINGTLRVRVGAAAEGTLLDEVTRLLDKAVETRWGYVRLVERAAQLYAPVVHLTALATMLGWVAFGASWHDAIVTAIAVLIITCPCALGLAIPAVQVVAAGALFRSGVLLNSGDAIERLATVDTVVFDKTGTLTLPEPEVVNAADIPPDILALAGRLALTSRHPLAAAVARAADAKLPLAGALEEPGQGVRAAYSNTGEAVDGGELRLGRPSFCGAEAEAARVTESDPEASAIAFLHGDARYVFAVRQRIRADALEVVTTLKARGYAVEILSGDRMPAVAHVARILGIAEMRAAVTPADKIAHIEELKRAGRNVLMVGDGINDAPALAAANVSLSPVTAAHLTQSAADAVFLGDRLEPVAAALAIARRAKRIMSENLWMAVVYNAIAVPVAIVGLATPLIAALAMSGSSILVTTNSLRARAAGSARPRASGDPGLPKQAGFRFRGNERGGSVEAERNEL